MGAKMTAITEDKPCKRAYLGDNTGKLRNINLKYKFKKWNSIKRSKRSRTT